MSQRDLSSNQLRSSAARPFCTTNPAHQTNSFTTEARRTLRRKKTKQLRALRVSVVNSSGSSQVGYRDTHSSAKSPRIGSLNISWLYAFTTSSTHRKNHARLMSPANGNT